MPSKFKSPEFETRTRIICHFPLNRKANQAKPNQIHVMRAFIKFLRHTAITGFSMSSLMDTVCSGFWRTSPAAEFEEENVVVFVIDHPLEKNNPDLWAFARETKHEIQKLYARYGGGKEQDVWIVVHSIDRLV